MEALAQKVEVSNSERAIKVTMVMLDYLVYRTPVDTSTALSNWQVRLDAKNSNFIDAYVPGNLGYTQAPSARETLDVATRILQGKKPGQTIYLFNNAPYIMDLEHGTSKQAPTGFMSGAMLLGRKTASDFKLDK